LYKKSILVIYITGLVILILSGCQAPPRPIKLPPSGGGYTPRVTKQDILESGGSCGGNFCTDTNGRHWDCGGGGYCSRVKLNPNN
jgi:hypothetical protein